MPMPDVLQPLLDYEKRLRPAKPSVYLDLHFARRADDLEGVRRSSAPVSVTTLGDALLYLQCQGQGNRTLDATVDGVRQSIPIQWVQYVVSTINYVTRLDGDVLSGEFTGCIMASFIKSDGKKCVAHIPRDANDPKVDPVKTAWTLIATKGFLHPYGNGGLGRWFRPLDAWSDAELAAAGPQPTTLGLALSNGECYSLLVVHDQGTFDLATKQYQYPLRYRVEGVRRAHVYILGQTLPLKGRH